MRLVAWTTALIACALWSGSASAQCTRHFYNNTSVPWSVNLGASGLCNGSPVCTIRPYSTATLVYFPFPISPMGIASPIYNRTFGLTGCKIIHSGNTGAIAVNSPADGDVTTCGRSWNCTSLRRAVRKKSG
jgi:hypothetical protein